MYLAFSSELVISYCAVCFAGFLLGLVACRIMSLVSPVAVATEATSSLTSALSHPLEFPGDAKHWHVTKTDLEFFNAKLREPDSVWQLMFDKDFPGSFRYKSYRRTLPDGSSEYKSVTVVPDVTKEEYTAFLFDDAARMGWESFLISAEVVEQGDTQQREEVVRWIRKFPFGFITEREYTIARRAFKEHGFVFGITKGVQIDDHHHSGFVKVDDYYSMWRSATVTDPWGSANPACETILLHREQLKVPEKLAKIAVRCAMMQFVKKMVAATHPYVANIRAEMQHQEAEGGLHGLQSGVSALRSHGSHVFKAILPAVEKVNMNGGRLRRIGLIMIATCVFTLVRARRK